MKRHLLSFFALVPVLVILIGGGLAGGLATLLPNYAQAYAATPANPFGAPTAPIAVTTPAASPDDYIFYTPTGSDFLGQLQQTTDQGNDTDADLSQTGVFVRGGVFGSTPEFMQYSQSHTDCAMAGSTATKGLTSGCNDSNSHFGGQDADIYVYTITYGCQPGKGLITNNGSGNSNENYTIEYDVSVYLNSHAQNKYLFLSNGTLNSTVDMHWAGIWSITHYPAAPGSSTVALQPPDSPNVGTLPKECRPPMPPGLYYTTPSLSGGAADVTAGSGTTELNTGISNVNLTIPVYAQAGAAEKQSWGNLDSLATQATAAASSSSTSTPPALSCNAGLNPLNWLICGIVDGLVSIIGDVDNIINDELDVGNTNSSSTASDPNSIFCDSNTPGYAAWKANSSQPQPTCVDYQQAWSSFRDIALGLMVVAGLIMVSSQALGFFEILDAYTIRKILPRILIAALAITLSWQLMQFFVELSNSLGYGVRYLIYYPFRNISDAVNLSGGNDWAVSLAGSFAITAMGVFGLLSFVATAALAVFVAFLILVVRQLFIIMMIIIAPIAIVLYILPNTHNLYKLWWSSFSKALLMFPLITGLIAVGRVFSAVAGQQTQTQHGGNPINALIAFAAYFAPYFAIPFTFKFAGGALSGASNLISSRAQGGFGALRQFRANQTKKRVVDRGALYNHKFKTGEFSNPVPARFTRLNRLTNKAVSTVNTTGLHANAGLLRGGLGFGARGKAMRAHRLLEAAKTASEEEAIQKNASFNGFGRLMMFTAKNHGDEAAAERDWRKWYESDDNEYGRALEHDELEEKLRESKGRMRTAGGYNAGRAVAAYLNMAKDGTAIRDVKDQAQLAAWVSEGNSSTAYDLFSQAGSTGAQVGRRELKPSQDHRAALTGVMAAAARGEDIDNYDLVLSKATMSGAGGQPGIAILQDSPSRVIRSNVDNAMNVLEHYHPDDPDNSVDFDDVVQAASVIVDLQNSARLGYGSVDNKNALATAMNKGDRQAQLSKFLEQRPEVRAEGPPTADGTYPTAPGISNAEYINQIVGGRYSQDPLLDGTGLAVQPPPEQDQQQ